MSLEVAARLPFPICSNPLLGLELSIQLDASFLAARGWPAGDLRELGTVSQDYWEVMDELNFDPATLRPSTEVEY